MKLHLVPEELGFYDLFRRDIATCQAGVTALTFLLHNFRDLRQHAHRIHQIENEGDDLTAQIFALLNRTFITPFEREDIIALGSIIDDVLDAVDEVATMLSLYGITQPTVYLLEAGTLLAAAVEALVKAMDQLRTARGIAPLAAEVHRLETEADGLYHNAIAELFLPGAYTPLDVLKWNRLYDLMERAVDKCEDVANILQNVALKQA